MTSFHNRLKSFGLRWFFVWQIFLSNKCFSSSNFVFIQPCPQGFFNIFWHGKQKKWRKMRRKWFCRLTLHGTFDISLQWWLLIRLKFFSNFFNRKTPSYSQNLISFNHFFSYNHLLLSSSLATSEESGPLSPGSQRVMI